MEELIRVERLKTYFEIKATGLRDRPALLKAVDDVSFSVCRGEVLGIVGESGCGKSTLARTMLRLADKTEGGVRYRGREVFDLSGPELKTMRRQVQMIFQDPFCSLNPRKKVRSMIAQPLRIHRVGTAAQIEARVKQLMAEVGLSEEQRNRYPHQFSGGQRQRIGIARALALNPQLVVCDEAVSALDVSIQAQILNLLLDIQEKYHLTYVFIAHDLAVVQFISTRILVMYLGKIVEEATKEALGERRLHPYTVALFDAFPAIDPEARRDRATVVMGDVPSPINPPAGCHFHPRCPHRMPVCEREYPPLKEVEPQRRVACHLY